MKTTTLLLAVTLLPMIAQADIIRVNNLGFGANYTSVATAVAASNPGDTIHIEGSPQGYGNLTINSTWPLVIIGNGYFLGGAENTGLQAYEVETAVGNLILSAGTEGTVVMGIHSVANVSILSSDVTFAHNRVDGLFSMNSGTGRVIAQNYIAIVDIGASSVFVPDLTITNNYIGTIIIGPTNAGTFTHNVVLGNASMNNLDCSNNVFVSGVVTQGTGNTFTNNIFWNNLAFITGNGNLESEVMTDVFAYTGSTDGQWRLMVGSPALGAGTFGTDIGMYGGSTPYVEGGIAEIPTIYELATPGTAIQGETINVTLSTRSFN